MPLYIYTGQDEFRLSEALRALKRSIDVDGSLAANTSTLAGRGLTPQTLMQHISALPFLSPARLVIVEGLAAAAGNRRGVTEAWQPVLDFLPQMPPTNHLVLVEGEAARAGRGEGRGEGGSNALLNAFRRVPGAVVQPFAPLEPWRRRGQPSEVDRWLQQRAREQQVAIDQPALIVLADLVGTNLRMLATELGKLAVYADGRPITAEDVRLLTPEAREESIFELVDAMVEGRAPEALRMLRTMLDDGTETPLGILVRVARQLRLLVRATELLADGADEQHIGERTGARGFPLTKLVRQARQTNSTAAVAALHAAEAADHAIKTGQRPDMLALELLVTRLAEIARPVSGGRPRR